MMISCSPPLWRAEFQKDKKGGREGGYGREGERQTHTEASEQYREIFLTGKTKCHTGLLAE